jgi:hypothetical protein
MGVPEILVLLLLCLLVGLALWLVERAKPLGANPYHWGQWCAICSAGSVIYLLTFGVSHVNANWLMIGALTLLMVVAAVGLFRRKRLGALAYGAAYLVNIATLNDLIKGGWMLIAMLIQAVYFWKRWDDMDWW